MWKAYDLFPHHTKKTCVKCRHIKCVKCWFIGVQRRTGVAYGGGCGRAVVNLDDVIKWKHFSRYWYFVRGPHKGQWRGTLMFSLICAWTNGWVKKSRGRWFETPSHLLWRHCNDICQLFLLQDLANLTAMRFHYTVSLCLWNLAMPL